MRFEIDRASGAIFDARQPCPDAVLVDGKWVIDIDSIEDFLTLLTAEGSLIVCKDRYDDHYRRPLITIYDDYVE